MAAQMNMTLPLILVRIHESTGQKKLAYIALICLNCLAVVLVMSRNGIGTMLIILTLYFLFNHKRLAVVAVGAIIGSRRFTRQYHADSFRAPYPRQTAICGIQRHAPRSLIWRVAWDHIKIHPHAGRRARWSQASTGRDRHYHAHNNLCRWHWKPAFHPR